MSDPLRALELGTSVRSAVSRRALRFLLAAVIAAFGLALATPGDAGAAVTGWSEPAFTKTSGNNTYWWNWTAVKGVDGTGAASYTYYLCLSTYRNGVQEEFNNHTNGPGSANCTGSLVGAPWTVAPTGNFGATPYSTGTVLADGATYAMCATGAYASAVLWRSDVASSNACPTTTIDRNKPSVQVAVNGTQEYTSNPSLSFSIHYQDATSPPWPANYRCIKVGGPCTGADTFQYDPNCSVPLPSGNPRVRDFNCSGDASGQPDGPIHFCAAAADSAIPDNGAGPNQFVSPSGAGVTSDTANISDVGCGYVVLDRTRPQVTATASATTVTAGELVNFTAAATDATSGIAGGYAWTFGDNTAGAGGGTTSHTYTQPGTYVARVTAADGAGNVGEGTRTITVKAAGQNGGGTGNNGATGNNATNNGATGGGGGTLVTNAPTKSAISLEAGGGGTQAKDVGALRVLAPKRFTVRPDRRRLPIALTFGRPGKVDLALLRGGRVLSKASANVKRAGTFGFRLTLPKGLKAGTCVLQVAFTPAGASRATMKRLTIAFVAKRKASTETAAPGPPRLRGGPAYGAR